MSAYERDGQPDILVHEENVVRYEPTIMALGWGPASLLARAEPARPTKRQSGAPTLLSSQSQTAYIGARLYAT